MTLARAAYLDALTNDGGLKEDKKQKIATRPSDPAKE
jgi:hypothetical protein